MIHDGVTTMSRYYRIGHWDRGEEGQVTTLHFSTVAEAAQHRTSASDYILAVEDGVARRLTEEEIRYLRVS
jgi:hypothetical protein